MDQVFGFTNHTAVRATCFGQNQSPTSLSVTPWFARTAVPGTSGPTVSTGDVVQRGYKQPKGSLYLEALRSHGPGSLAHSQLALLFPGTSQWKIEENGYLSLLWNLGREKK